MDRRDFMKALVVAAAGGPSLLAHAPASAYLTCESLAGLDGIDYWTNAVAVDYQPLTLENLRRWIKASEEGQ